jgi:hypothetical protein
VYRKPHPATISVLAGPSHSLTTLGTKEPVRVMAWLAAEITVTISMPLPCVRLEPRKYQRHHPVHSRQIGDRGEGLAAHATDQCGERRDKHGGVKRPAQTTNECVVNAATGYAPIKSDLTQSNLRSASD